MRKRAFRSYPLLVALLMCVAFLGGHPHRQAAAEALQIADPRWTVENAVEDAPGFTGPLNEYRVRQARGSDLAKRLNPLLDGSLALKAGNPDKAGAYASGKACRASLARMSGTPLTQRQAELVAETAARLAEAGWQPHAKPYAQGTLLDRFQAQQAEAMGLLQTIEDYLNAVGPQGVGLTGEEQYVVLAGDIDGYPIVPELFGAFADSDVPMYAGLLLRGEQVIHLSVGCGYDLARSVPLAGQPLTGLEASDIAIRYAYAQWQAAWSAKALDASYGLDYPAFWQAHDPRFTLRATDALPCYYARDGVLRPCWQVDCRIDVTLVDDDALAPQERHTYVPERIDMSYFVDAMTGEMIR